MDRRSFFRRTSFASAAFAFLPLLAELLRPQSVYGQAARATPDLSSIGSACGLPPVHVTADREIRTVVGLRPYRPSGFVVRAEPLGKTLVVHNYGHGGAGIGKQTMLRALMPESRDLSVSEYPFPVYRQVRQFDTMLVEPPIYPAALLDDHLIHGGRIVVRELPDRTAVKALPERLVFNGTGLGAKALFGDEELTPVQGQITVLRPQPEVQYAVCPGDTYMFSRADGIVLGGTHEAGVSCLQPDMEKQIEIMAAHAAFFNGFRQCPA